MREISNGLERARMRDQFVLKQVWAARPVDIRRAMLDFQPNIVHFCGHGGTEGIFFEDDQGQAYLVEAKALAEFFSLFKDSVECVILNACYSETQARAIAEHIPFVIGMPKEIGDDAAIEFAVAFYDAIGAGRSYEFAYNVARNALQWRNFPDTLKPILIKTRQRSAFDYRSDTLWDFRMLKSYRQFVGREKILAEAITALSDPLGKWIVGIDGMGGIGKTALAVEIAERCLRDTLFEHIIWIQSPKSLSSTGIPCDQASRLCELTYEAVLDAIAWQLGYPSIQSEDIRSKEERTRTLLEDLRTLLVLDNLESAAEPQDKIAERLDRILKPSKALLTSRYRFKDKIYSIHLSGLNEEESIKLLQQEAAERGIARVQNASINELREIANAVGGLPLALKLVVGQLGHMPLEVVLKGITLIPSSYGDEYVSLYRNIFLPSWALLSNNAQRVLVSMAHLSPDTGGTLESISFISGFSEAEVIRCINELWSLSFVEVGESSSLNDVIYYLHPITQYFVLSDVVNIL
ncbi:MAG: NB-ARC domain-containing protein [Candidatus Bathyarchaeia archaeon]